MNLKPALPMLLASVFFMEACAPSPQTTDEAIEKIAATLPRQIDAATLMTEVKSDAQGDVVYVVSVDTSMVKFPSTTELMHLLCDVRTDGPPAGSKNPFSSITYIYKDPKGDDLGTLRLNRGECPGQAL